VISTQKDDKRKNFYQPPQMKFDTLKTTLYYLDWLP